MKEKRQENESVTSDTKSGEDDQVKVTDFRCVSNIYRETLSKIRTILQDSCSYLLSFRGDPPEPPVIPVVIVNKQQTSSSPPSERAPRTTDRVPEGSITTASGTAAPETSSDPESEDVALEGRFGLWKSFDKLSPKIFRKRLNYRQTRSSSSLVAAINVGIARNFSL